MLDMEKKGHSYLNITVMDFNKEVATLHSWTTVLIIAHSGTDTLQSQVYSTEFN